MLKPISNDRHYIITYMPLRLIMFLIRNKILHQFVTYVLKDQKGMRTAPEIIKFMSICKKNVFNRLFIWINTNEGIEFWLNIDRKWQNG